MGLPLSSSLPGPTEMTLPRVGFSLAESGTTMPVFVSASDCLTITRSCRGRSFIAGSSKTVLQTHLSVWFRRSGRLGRPDLECITLHQNASLWSPRYILINYLLNNVLRMHHRLFRC